MSLLENDRYQERKLEERGEWLKEINCEEKDVLKDDEGEYVMVRNEIGGFNFVYLPEELNENYYEDNNDKK